MASGLSANSVWEVEIGGSDTANGGSFVTGASGTDYSRQTSPQWALSSVTSSGAGNTVLSSSAAASMVGNGAYVVSGTNFNSAQWYQVASVVAGVSITFTTSNAGNSICSGVGASGVINIGGAFASPGRASGLMVASNVMYILYSASVYTISTASANVPGGGLTLPGNSAVVGYATNRTVLNTDANRPHLQVGVGVSSITLIAGAPLVSNMILDGNAQATSRCSSTGSYWNCLIENWTNYGLAGGGGAFFCEFTGCTGAGNTACYAPSFFCVAHGNSAGGFQGYTFCSIAYGNTNAGFQGLGVFVNCIAYGNTGASSDGFVFNQAGAFFAINCIAESNGRYGFNGYSTGYTAHVIVNCSVYGNNGGGAQTANLNASPGLIATASSAFVAPGSQDFRLNNTANAGALLRAVGFPTTAWPSCAAAMLAKLDIGAAQTGYTTPAAATSVYSGIAYGALQDALTGALHASNIATPAGAHENLSTGILLAGHQVDDVAGSAPSGGLVVNPGMGGGMRG